MYCIQVAKRSDIVSLSLPSEKITSNVLFGDGGLLEGFLATGENLSGMIVILIKMYTKNDPSLHNKSFLVHVCILHFFRSNRKDIKYLHIAVFKLCI